MRKWWILIFCIIIAILLYGGSMISFSKDKDETVQNDVAKKYMNDQNLIHAYPFKEDSQYLSESIGMYMKYLVQVKDANEFEDQYIELTRNFVVQKGDSEYLTWVLGENSSVNALIDDVRIIDSLHEASRLFGEEKYQELADRLFKTIANKQRSDGLYVDFYDWKIEKPASRVTLSYLTLEFFELFSDSEQMRGLLEKADDDSLFFPEYYDVEKNNYIKSEEVHMVDQLLIASNKEYIENRSEKFENWVVKEWKTNNALKGKYNRKSLKPSVDYESLSVYYYLHAYFLQIGQRDLAKEVSERARQLASESLMEKAHFFDYMQYQLMLLDDREKEK